jgi:hypothetical protein
MTCTLELSANLPQASSKIAPSSPPFSFSAPLKGVEAQQRPPLPQAVRGAANGIKFRNRSRKNLLLTPSSLSVGEAFTGMHPLYQDVCSVLSQADRRKGTLKRLCLAGGIRNKRATLALASETSRWVELPYFSAQLPARDEAEWIGRIEESIFRWNLGRFLCVTAMPMRRSGSLIPSCTPTNQVTLSHTLEPRTQPGQWCLCRIFLCLVSRTCVHVFMCARVCVCVIFSLTLPFSFPLPLFSMIPPPSL